MKRKILIITLLLLSFVVSSSWAVVSNASLEDEDCSDISDWFDGDSGNAVSEQITFDSKSTFKFDTNTSYYALRYKNIGSINGLGNRIVLSLNLYCDAVGLNTDNDHVELKLYRDDWQLYLLFASNGLFIHNGAAYPEVGTNLVVLDTWQEWTFDIDLSGGTASAVCDVYLNGSLEASDVDCSFNTGSSNGLVYFFQRGHATNDRVVYMDWFKVGDGFASTGWTGKISGVTNPAKIMRIDVANISKVMGVP